MPRDNVAFERVVTTKAIPGDRDASLALMRQKMLKSERFAVGVFIGGMEGVEEEYRMFREMHPRAMAIPVASTGAAALIIYKSASPPFPSDLLTDLAYPSLFRRYLQGLNGNGD
jgi:hypothetical protein